MNSEAEKYYDLIIRFLAGETEPEEDSLLLDWKQASPENESLFNSIKQTWFATSQVNVSTSFDENAALDIVHRNLNVSSSTKASKAISLGYILKVAAVLIGVFALGSLTSYLLFQKNSSQVSQSMKIFAPKGSRSVAYLPDGSRVWLNAGSELTYVINSGKNRVVQLTGEAFFKVKSDKTHPFIVMANGVAIKAVGTSFNVKAYPEERKITTTLVEGVVNIEGPTVANNKPVVITMKPNQKVVVFSDSLLYFNEKKKISNEQIIKNEAQVALDQQQFVPAIKTQNVNTDLYTSWKDDRWIIDSEEFGNLATLLERRYNVNIQFQSNDIKRYRFSGTFTNETIEQAMALMRYSLPFNYIIDKNNIIIKVDPLLMKTYNQAYEKIK